VSATTAGAGLFPLPLLDDPPGRSSVSRSRRIQRRHRVAQQVTDLANDCLESLNEIHTSFFDPEPLFSIDSSQSIPVLSSNTNESTHFNFSPRPSSQDGPPPNPNKLPCPAPSSSASQARLAAHVYSCAARFHRRRAATATSGSAAPCDDSLSTELITEHQANELALLAASYTNGTASAAVPLIADRVALPSTAGAVDLLDVLPPQVAAMYRDPNQCLRPDDNVAEPVQRVRPHVFASHEEYVKLLRRMVATGMVEFTTKPEVINGLFGVPKPDGSIRLIVDGRPSCARFVDAPRVVLPTPDLLPKLTVEPQHTVYVAKSDLADFFYRFRVPRWMLPYFALPAIDAGELQLGSEFGGDHVRIYPCLAVLAMGWSHSVYLAQTAHEHLLDTQTLLRPADRITAGADRRIDRCRHLVYVDDLIVLGIDPDAVRALQVNYISATDRVRLPAKPSKVVLPSCEGVDCLGIEVHGREHTVAPRADKLDRLRMDTYWLLQRGTATGREMAQLVGRWTWVMLVARPALAIFNSVYRFIQAAGRKPFGVWPSVATELWAVARIAPLLVARLNDTWQPQVFAVDASLDGLGVVAARVPTDLVERAARVAGSSSFASAADGKPDTEQQVDDELLDRRWSTLVAAPWRDEEHINCLELRAVSTAVRRVLSSPSVVRDRCARLLILSDSQVAVGALSKGRSSSHTLLRRLRPLSALLLASGLQLALRWIPSFANPADAPSRVFSCPRPLHDHYNDHQNDHYHDFG